MSVIEKEIYRLPYENISKELLERGISISFIARKIKTDPSHLSRCLCGTSNLTEKNRQKINELLGTNY